MSINKSDPETREKPKEDTGRQNVTETVAEVHAGDPKSKEPMGMAATICPDGLLKEVIIDGYVMPSHHSMSQKKHLYQQHQ